MKKNICLICNKNKQAKSLLLCLRCAKNPFFVEDLRNLLAMNKNLKLFKSIYSGAYSEIQNLNTGKFWDTRFTKESSLYDQDEMTKEKIYTIESFIPKKALTILDLGIGQGYLEEVICEKKLRHRIYGVDISKNSINKLRKKYKGEFVVSDVFSIDKLYEKKLFDVIVAIELIEHISPKKIFSFYKKVYNRLKPRGIFIISTPLNEGLRNKKENPSGHVRDYTIPILEMEFALSGFNILNKKTLYAFENKYKIKKLLSIFLKNRWKPNNAIIYSIKSSPSKTI